MNFKRGLKPARPGAVKMLFRAYAGPGLPKRPDEFGDPDRMANWFMLANDRVGCCFFSGAAHQLYDWSLRVGPRVRISTADVLSDYADCTGYVLGDASTDNGTDMQAGASYLRKTGLRDAYGKRHKIKAYVALEAGNVDEILTAAWLFGSVGLGLTIGHAQEEQFMQRKPWDGATGGNPGGHFVPLLADRDGTPWVITWGGKQAVTRDFIEKNCDQAIAFLSPDMFKDGRSIDGFDMETLTDNLAQLTA